MSPANGGDDRDEVEPGDRREIEERVRRALHAEADQLNADLLRPQPMSNLDELARRRQRSSWLLPVAVAAAVAAVALLGILVPQLLDGPESAQTAASGSATNTRVEPPGKTALESLTSPDKTPQSTTPAPTASDVADLPGPPIQGPRGLVVTLPTGWIQQPGQNAACLRPSEAPGNGSALCDKGVLISATEPGKQIEELVAASCDGPSGSVDEVVSDTRPAAGTTADYREYMTGCGGAQMRKAVWFISSSQLAIVASGTVAKDPVTQKIVNSIDLSNYAALSTTEATATPPPPTGGPTVDPSDVATRESTQRAHVTDLGYTPTAAAVDPNLSISCVIAADSNGRYTVFFFVDDVYVGTDSSSPSTSVSATLLSDTQAQVTYQLSDGMSMSVPFAWDGAMLSATVALPPTAEEDPAGPYR